MEINDILWAIALGLAADLITDEKSYPTPRLRTKRSNLRFQGIAAVPPIRPICIT